ncbi:hypothetical protein NEDG_01956 [Nematocida displodere]|uniref:UDENN domain-containing protein n=1 Tax=Nematocida displodere TaxID=1805483 RepID=A0A177EKB7_9MICR|nr:hypothetical protein NEDG_01956 [Nematocida displodere]
MVYSAWYLENLEMRRETEVAPPGTLEAEGVVTCIGEVLFDVDAGPVVKEPSGLSDLEEAEVAFASLPDVRSAGTSKESFIFCRDAAYYHVSFIQEPCPGARRGYVQRSVFVRSNKMYRALPQILSESLQGPEDYTRDEALRVLVGLGERTIRDWPHKPAPSFEKVLGRHRDALVENVLCGRSFLVLGSAPTEVSEVVCRLSGLGGFEYGGVVVPYKTSLAHYTHAQGAIVGSTNHHLFNEKVFDNVLDLTSGKYRFKAASSSKRVEAHLKDLEAYFLDSPGAFAPSEFMARMSEQGTSLHVKRVFRDFFKSLNFNPWLRAMTGTASQHRPQPT